MTTGTDLNTLFARMAESLANTTLGLDKASQERLAALEGRKIQVESTLPDQVWCIQVRDARIEVSPGPAESPDVVAKGKPQHLLAWFASPQGQAAQEVEIEGDAATLGELAGVFKALAPQGFAPPISGQDLLGAAELAAAVVNSAAESLTGAWREATAERFVNRSRYSDFEAGIESLSVQVEDLDARVRALEAAAADRAPAKAEPAPPDADSSDSGARESPAPGADGPDSGAAESPAPDADGPDNGAVEPDTPTPDEPDSGAVKPSQSKEAPQ